MRSASFLRIAVGVALSSVACGPNTFYPGLGVTPSVFLANVRVIAIAPLASDSVEVPDSVAFQFEELLAEQLTALDFTVLTAREYDAVWQDVYADMQVVDSVTGVEDSLRLEQARTAFFVRLDLEWNVDVVAFPEIWEVVARYAQAVADWDGTSQPIAGTGARTVNAIAAAFGATSSYLAGGQVPAISFGVVLETPEGETVYESGGGIAVRRRISVVKGGWFLVPDEELFAEAVRNEHAVTLALRQLAEPIGRMK